MEKSEKTRKYIIEVASPIFNRKGYSGTSLSDVLDGTGLTKGSIYGNFRNKDELALAALEYNFTRVSGLILSAVKAGGNACDRLVAFAETYRKFLDTAMQSGGCPVMNAAVDSDDGNPLIKRKVDSFIRLWHSTIAKIIKDGKKIGEIRQDADEDVFAALFISLIEGSLMLSKTTGKNKYVNHAVDHVISMVEGLKAD